jgi:hypothetical protein
VVVLGERFGHQPDLKRARAVMLRLARSAPVTLALESVHERYQRLLDGFEDGRLAADDLPELMDWENVWGFAWKPYAPLVTAASRVDHGLAIGMDFGSRPAGVEVPLPRRYIDVLRDGMAGFEPSPGYVGDVVQAMAWRDHHMADLAIQGWNGEGYLVVVVGRGQVEGGKGIAWQLARMTSVPVSSAVLKAGDDPPCHVDDRLWR